jgi:arabinogalactan endo-1,4-beta-galactosidase
MRKKTFKAMSAALALVMGLSLVVVNPTSDMGTVKADSWSGTSLISNGDFESAFDSSTNWTVVGASSSSKKTGLILNTDTYAENNTSQVCKINNNSTSTSAMSLSQTVELEAGTYKVSLKQDGATVQSGMKITVTAGDITYVDYELPATTGWDKWTTVETDSFTLEAATTITLTVGGDVAGGYWGDIDDIEISKLEAEDASEAFKTYEELQTLLSSVPEDYETFGFTAASVAALTRAVTTAEAVTEESSSEDITSAYTKLQKALGRLTFTGKVSVDAIEGYDADNSIRGVDVSSYISLMNTFKAINAALPEDADEIEKVGFRDWNGNLLDEQGFFDLLAASGVNYIRTRVWNDPYDSDGNGYGGGNNDLATAILIGQYATKAGMNNLIDFHFSDLWADPGKQTVPKAWTGYTVDQKATAISEYVTDCLTQLNEAGVKVGMVQIGNETTNSICGESSWANKNKLFDAGCDAVHDFNEANGTEILAALHFTNPERAGNYASFAKNLAAYDGDGDGVNEGVSYDVFASSWYPYWHGTLANLTSVLTNIAETYDKYVVVAETSWAYTLADGDGHDNTVRKGQNSTNPAYDFTVQGQADEVYSVIDAMNSINVTLTNGDSASLGMFYWEGAWIPVQYAYDSDGNLDTEILAENKAYWEEYGSGWASSYASEYDAEDAGKWYGGSAVDNQAFFDFYGNPLASLNVFKYVAEGSGDLGDIASITAPSDLSYVVGDEISLPETVTVAYSEVTTGGAKGKKTVTWNEEQLAEFVNDGVVNKAGEYTVTGTVEGTGVTETSIKITVVPLQVQSITNPETTITQGGKLTIPATVEATYNNGTKKNLSVSWNSEELFAAVSATDEGVYTVTGTVGESDKTVTWKITVESDAQVDTTTAYNSNGGFETVTTSGGNNTEMANWTFNKLSTGGFLMVRYKNKLTTHGGSYALLCGYNNGTTGTAGKSEGVVYQTIENLEAGIYQYSGYLRDSSVEGFDVYMFAYTYTGDDDGSVTYKNPTYKKDLSLTSSYTQNQLKNIEVKEGETLVVGFYYYCESSPMGVYADDFTLNKVTAPSTYTGSNVAELAIGENAALTVAADETCNVPEDVTVDVDGTLNVNGTLNVSGKVNISGNMEVNGSVAGQGSINVEEDGLLTNNGKVECTVVTPEDATPDDSEPEDSTTEEPTTEAPTTEEPTTEAPTTEAPTTEAPTTEEPTTEAPTTEAPTTEAPTTEEPTTEAPTTEAPTTEEPTTEVPTTEEPTTEVPTTEEPTTEAPTTEEPTTEEPTTEAPTTEEPTTEAPSTTEEPSTEAPATTAKPAVKGTVLKDTATKAKYKVTSASKTNPTVAYTGTTSTAKKIVVPSKVKVNGVTYTVTSIVASAFKNNTKMTSVTIAKTVKTIGKNTFYGCKKLKTVTFKSGSKLTTINASAFAKCTALTKITIPAKVTKIGSKAFYGCTKLKTVTIKTKKLTTKKVGSKAFTKISSKATIKVPASKLKAYKKLLSKKGITGKKQTVKKISTKKTTK